MAESVAEAKYREFESLRKRFGGEQGAEGEKCKQQQQIFRRETACKRRPNDPRANAPPLVPLVEEGDQLEEVESHRAVIRGHWKHSAASKSNHLNYPDFDALETASVTSCSSAYSSRSESSILSPPCGSVTELSDGGSCDTFQEYDISGHRHRPRPHHFSLTGTAKQAPANHAPIKSSPSDVNFVKDYTQTWNKAIGEWKFEGISPLPSPLIPHTTRVTNEVRLPTPVCTPQGSTDNLLEIDSRCSLLSSEDENSSTGGWVPGGRARLGKFVRGRSLSTSNLVSAFQSMDFSQISHMRSFSGTDLLLGDEEGVVCSESEEERGEQIVVRTEPEMDEEGKGDQDERIESAAEESVGLRMASSDRLGMDLADLPAPATATPVSAKWVEPSKETGLHKETLRDEQDKSEDVKSVVRQRALLFGGMKKQQSGDHL